MTTDTARSHAIPTRAARVLADQFGPLPADGASLLVGRSQGADELHLKRTGKDFALTSPSLPTSEWADAFGLLPYKAGRVALATSPRGAWMTSKARVLGA